MEFEVKLVAAQDELIAHLAEWDDLACNAAEPNVFYESWMLLPALRLLSAEAARFLELWEVPKPPGSGGRRLLGFFPLTVATTYRRAPVRHYGNWMHIHCYLGTPLIRKGMERSAFRALMTWLESDAAGFLLFGMNRFRADGPIAESLRAVLSEDGRKVDVTDDYVRPRLDCSIDSKKYLQDIVSGDQRRKIRARERHLCQLGALEMTSLCSDDDVTSWLNQFLQLESSGWKAQSGTAMALDGGDRAFFEEICRGAFARGQLLMFKLSLAGKAIAMTCNFVSGGTVFVFKIAYDEELKKHAPGVLLALKQTMALLEQEGISELDSCSPPGPSVWSHLWKDGAPLQSLAISNANLQGRMVVAVGGCLGGLLRNYRALRAGRATGGEGGSARPSSRPV